MQELQEVTTEAVPLPERCRVLGFGGPHCITMPQTMPGVVMYANGLVNHR